MLKFIKQDGWIDVIENEIVINQITVFNKYMSYDLIIENLNIAYADKFELENLLIAIINKYKVKGCINDYDLDLLQNRFNHWIVENSIINNLKFINNHFKKDNLLDAYNLIVHIYYRLLHSKIKMNMHNFYLRD